MGCKEDCCIGPIPFWWFVTPFYATCLWKFWFFRTTYHRDSKPVPLDLAHLKPYIHVTHSISMHGSLSKSTKCEIYATLLNSSKHKMKKTSIWTGKKYFRTRLENLHREVSGMPITMHYTIQNQQNGMSLKFMPVYWTPPNTCHSSPLNAFSQSKSTKCEIYACLLNSPLHKMKKDINLNREKVFQKAWKSAQTGFSYANHNALYQNFVWQVLFQLWRFFWIFDKKV